MNKFEIDTNNIHVANSEKNISHTIEELLGLNKLLSARTDTEITDITQKQLNSEDYMNKPSRGEQDEITERQFTDRQEDPVIIQEVQIQEASEEDGGHQTKRWDTDKEEMRGHENIPSIWLEVYHKEDKRKEKPINKKL